MRRPFVLLGGALLLAPAVARASPLIETAGAVGGNAGEQAVVAGPSAASTYFNPALLMEADDEVLLGFSLVSEQLGVTLAGRNGGDVPLVVAGRDVITPGGQPLPNAVVPTTWLQQGCAPGAQQGQCPAPGYAARPRQGQGTSGKTRTYLTLGLVDHLVKDRFTIGLYAMLPLTSFMSAQAFYADEREALFSNSLHPELYGDRLTSVSIVAGAAFQLLPSLSVGAGLSLGLTNSASSADYVQDATNYGTLLLDNRVTTQVNVAPTVGVAWRPASGWRIGGAIHSPESFGIDTSIDASLPSGTESGATLHEVFDWMPWSVAAGAQAEVVHRGAYRMAVVASFDYAFWSAYQDRQGQSPGSYGAGLGWRDTMSVAVGARHAAGPVRAFVDLKYVPSPVPEQVGRSNYVDNDRVGISAGADVALHLGPARLRPGAQLFANRLVPRHNTKDDARIVDELPDGSVFGSTHDPVPGAQGLQTNNPGWPGFSSGGWSWGGAVTLAVPL